MADASQTTVIGPDTRIKGEISVDRLAVIHGGIEGQITAKGDIELASGSKCNASVDANKVTIEGTVSGDVSGREAVKLSSSARVKGDLIAAKLIVEEGAVFVGHCQVGGDAAKAAAARPRASPKPNPPPTRRLSPRLPDADKHHLEAALLGPECDEWRRRLRHAWFSVITAARSSRLVRAL